MTKYVALLRGVNVGGRTIKMAELKTVFEELGLTEVTTILQSGNVVFTSDSGDPASFRNQIGEALTQRFSYPAKLQVYPVDVVRQIVDGFPFDEINPDFQPYVVFLESGLATQLAGEATGLNPATEQIQLGSGDVVYWRVRKGMTLDSAFAKYLVKPPFKAANTTRNMRTLRKLIG